MSESSDPTLRRLNRDVLAVRGWPAFGGMFDLLNEWPADVPVRQGVYVFLAAGKRIGYPVGESSIVYFGKAEQQRGIRGRVGYHRGVIRRGPDERWPGHPAHEWLMARGGFCLYSVAPDDARLGSPSDSARWIERRLAGAFQRLHRTRPVGNGIGA
ncbi:hypothetical protein [Kitasatospora sp. NPDC088346]|uniref:hypothetical protein n=1 Tax=Kitasatospora sp. NPDC088346 TaxID=3364073 RepID=UPI00380A55D1